MGGLLQTALVMLPFVVVVTVPNPALFVLAYGGGEVSAEDSAKTEGNASMR